MTTIFRNALEIGSRIDQYEIEAVIGHGGFGISYRAVDTQSGARVAIKEYLPTELATRDADDSVCPLSESHLDNFQWGLERFLNEVHLLARFRHPNIVRVERAFEGNGTAYMVMAYEDGESLAARLKQDGTLASETLTAVTMPLLDGLELVHAAGFIHRDIKPSNIYLRLDGSPVLLDFGSARQALKGKTRTLTALVSAGYAPLEQYFSRSDLQGPWTDIYGLGATLYHAISGEPPIDAVERSRGVLGSIRDILPPVTEVAIGDFPSCLLAAVDHALRVDDQERPRNIEQWRRELTGEIPVPESRVTTLATPETRTPTARSRRTRGVEAVRPSLRFALAAAVVAIAAGSLGWWQWLRVGATLDMSSIDSRLSQVQARADEDFAALRSSPTDAESAAESSRRQINELTSKLRERESAGKGSSVGSRMPPSATTDNGPRERQQDTRVDELKAAPDVANAESDQVRQEAGELTARLKILEAVQNRSKVESSAIQQEVDALLAAAGDDIGRLRLTTPAGNNAYERYLRVLDLEENNSEAALGIERIVEKYIELAKRAQDEDKFDKAELYLNRGTSVLPDYAALAKARAELEYTRRDRRRGAVAALVTETAAAVSVPPGAGPVVSQASENAGNAEGQNHSENRQVSSAAQLPSNKARVREVIRPTTKISIAVFPGSEDYRPGNPSGRLFNRLGPLAGTLIRQRGVFDLRYSFYANVDDNKIDIPGVEKIWQGVGVRKQFDDARLLALGAQYDLDAVFIYRVFKGPPWSTWGDTPAFENVECQIFDIETSIPISNQGALDNVVDVIDSCLSDLQIARAERYRLRAAVDENDLENAARIFPDSTPRSSTRENFAQTSMAASNVVEMPHIQFRGTKKNAHNSSTSRVGLSSETPGTNFSSLPEQSRAVTAGSTAQPTKTVSASTPLKSVTKSVTVDARSAGNFGAIARVVDPRSFELEKAHVFDEPDSITLTAVGKVDLHPNNGKLMGVGPDGLSVPRGTSGCHLPLEEKFVDANGFEALGSVMQRGGALIGAFVPASVAASPRFRPLNDDFYSEGISSESLFLVGSRLDYSAIEPGTLFLGVNDCNPGNNSGVFSVVVSARP